MGDPKQVMCIEQNGRSLAGGWATSGRRGGPEATARRGGRDLQGGWLDCRSEFVLFHGNIKKLSNCLVLAINRRIYRLAERPVLVRAPTIISRLISGDRAFSGPKKCATEIPPIAEHQAQQGTRPDPLAE
ncbi:hypothetical protein [Burkholderia sp. BCC0397]|uniref:hypothetical protein n=1 Tax=Burkholderia sp. BCC0397 TaxID=486876 RepID=UPI00158C2B3A|nr:hypothetical protein [Burkholderia sp. BCC0397]